jgi:hypothetical protein
MVPETTSTSGVRAAAAFAFGKHGRGVPGGRAASLEMTKSRRSWPVFLKQQGAPLAHGYSCASQKLDDRGAGKENFPVV